MVHKIQSILFLLTLILLSFYSYSQVEHFLPYAPSFLRTLGHELRPLSGLFATALFALLFYFYAYFLRYYRSHPHQSINLWIITIPLVALPAYPAFLSHDVFEYAFWTRILIFHHQNPYLFAGSAFPLDPWSQLLHWPATPLPYGPGWLLTAVPAYILGFGNLLATLYAFKLTMLLFSVLTCYLILKLAWQLRLSPTPTLAFFLFNPLVILEFFYSPHNDIVMTALLLLSLLLLFSRRRLAAWAALVTSVSVKFTTLLVAPLFLPRFRHLSPEKVLYLTHLLTLLGALALVFSRTINAWYFAPLLAVSALLSRNRVIRYTVYSLSVGLILRYLPYIYLGYFDPGNKIRLILFLAAQLPFVCWYAKKFTHYQTSNLLNRIYLKST